MGGQPPGGDRPVRLRRSSPWLTIFGVRTPSATSTAATSSPPASRAPGQDLDSESVVKVRGVNVGAVESITLDDQGRALVRLTIEPDVEVPETATP